MSRPWLVVGLALACGGCPSMTYYDALVDPVSVLDLRLDPCPQSPNCVSSQAWREDQRVEPYPFAGDAAQALEELAEILEGWPRTRIVKRFDLYLHAEIKSRVFGFTDDLQLIVDERHGVIHVRSGARRGWSDLGVNRERVEALRAAFTSREIPLD